MMSAGKVYSNYAANNVVLVIAFVGLLLSAGFKRFPYALLLLVIGLLCVIYQTVEANYPNDGHWPRLSIWHPSARVPSTGPFERGVSNLSGTFLRFWIS